MESSTSFWNILLLWERVSQTRSKPRTQVGLRLTKPFWVLTMLKSWLDKKFDANKLLESICTH